MRNSSNSFIYILFTLGIQYCFNTNPEQAVIIRLETHVTHANTSVCLCVCVCDCVCTSLSKCQFLWDSWLYGRLVSSNLQAITPHVYFWNLHERAHLCLTS